MAEKELVIKISARDLSAPEMVKAREALAGIGYKAKEVSHETQAMGGIMQTAIGVMGGFISAQTILGGIKSAFSFAKEAAIGMNATLETSTLQFTTLMGDAGAAEAHVRSLFEFAKKTPFETGPIIEASKYMRTFGGEALDTTQNLKLIGDASAATNAPINELGMWVGRLYANLQAGKPIGEAAQRLGELAVLTPQARMELESMAKAGKSADEIFAKFQGQMGRFTGAMESQAGTWSGVVSTFKDTAQIVIAEAAKPLFDTLREGLASVNTWLEENGDTIATWRENLQTAFGSVVEFTSSTLVPALGVAVDAVVAVKDAGVGLIDEVSGWPQPLKDVAVGVGGLALAVWGLNTALTSTAAAGVVAFVKGLGPLVMSLNAAGMALVGGGGGVGLAAALTAAVSPAIAAAAAIASVAAVATVGYQAWKLWTEREDQARAAAGHATVAQRELALASEIAGRSITDQAEAHQVLAKHAKYLRLVTTGLSDEERVLRDNIGKSNEQLGIIAGSGLPAATRATNDATASKKALAAAIKKVADENKAGIDYINQMIVSMGNAELKAYALTRAESDTAESINDMIVSLHGQEDALILARAAAFEFVEEGLDKVPPALKRVKTEAADAGATISSKLGDVIKNLPQTFRSAFEGGGGLLGAFKSIGVQLGDALVGDLMDKLSKGLSTGLSGGGWAGFNPATVAFTAAFTYGISQVKDMHARMKEIQATSAENARILAEGVADYEKRLREIPPIYEDIFKQIESTELVRATDLGHMEAQLPILKEILAVQGDIHKTEQQIADLEDQLVPTWEDVDAAVKKYGLSIDGAGQKVQQLKVTQNARNFINDWEMLQRAGWDTAGMLDGMKEELSAMVGESQKYGTELPAQMKPILEALFKQGELTDENGNKLKDLTGIKFGAPVESEADIINTAIKALKDAMLEFIAKFDDLVLKSAGAAKDVYARWEREPWRDWEGPRFPKEGDQDPGDPGRDGRSPRTPRFATGVRNFRGGFAVVGEEGPELVRLPRGADVLPSTGTAGAFVSSASASRSDSVSISDAAMERMAQYVARAVAGVSLAVESAVYFDGDRTTDAVLRRLPARSHTFRAG